MSLINCEVNLILTWSANCVISEGNRAKDFAMTDRTRYVPVLTLSTQDYCINWNQDLNAITKQLVVYQITLNLSKIIS